MIKIIIPMGGTGKKFVESGYTFPKPLVEINGYPMIEVVVSNLKPKEPHQFIFICRREHLQKYALMDVLKLIAPGCEVVTMQGDTAGALCSVLLSMEFITPDEEIIIANADQYVDFSIDEFLVYSRKNSSDGCIMTFPSTHPKWSFAMVDENDRVQEVAEKRPISSHATAGVYYFKRGSDFLSAAERVLFKGATTMGEFYVCPVYNELILDGKHVTSFNVPKTKMHCLGTPEDVEAFLKSPISHMI